ncbi:MAG: cobalt ECF transporter T component CbiQ [Bacteroidota bacterium]|nr:cobalt ECF transporter T component CbiQ [Bacteroidota bacterium]
MMLNPHIGLDNKAGDVHPALKLWFVLLAMVAGLLSQSLVFSAILLVVCGLVSVWFSGIRAGQYLRWLFIPFFFILFGVITIAIEIHSSKNPSIISIHLLNSYLEVSQPSLMKALLLLTKSLSVTALFFMLILTTPVYDLIAVIRGKRSSLFVELVMLIYRQIFVISEVAANIRTAQQTRLAYQGFGSSVQSYVQLISRTFVLSFRRSSDMYNAMESRCFDGEINMLPRKFIWKTQYIVIAVSAEILLWGSWCLTSKLGVL